MLDGFIFTWGIKHPGSFYLGFTRGIFKFTFQILAYFSLISEATLTPSPPPWKAFHYLWIFCTYFENESLVFAFLGVGPERTLPGVKKTQGLGIFV
jgi:hypothetical protein